jgi:hypothetical protein
MPRIALDLSSLNQERRALQTLIAQQRGIDRQLGKQQDDLAAALRAGESPNVTVPLQQSITDSLAARQQLLNRRHEIERGIDRIADGLLRQRDPAQLVQTMDGGQPIALLPMRMETRYVPSGRPNKLRIRVYPDDINTIEHTPALTEPERQRGADYWHARFRGDDTDAERIARDLAIAFGRGRAAWVLRVMTPDNAGEQGDAEAKPRFPDLETIDARAKQTRAVLLPDRWCAIGYAAGRREVFRIWGKRIPDELLLSPDWLNAAGPEPLLGGERSWLADFDAALENGMAIDITQQQLDELTRQRGDGHGFSLATDTLERVLVVGLEWTKDAAQTADELAALLAAQRDSRGLGFLPLGTKTNNTEGSPAGFSPSDERVAPLTPKENAQLPKEKDALELLTYALGVPTEGLPADNIGNAHLAEQRTALHMMNALWRGTFGHYLMELWNAPGEEKDRLLNTPTLYDLRRYAVAYLRPGGPLPLLRINKQPYGLLPVVGKAFVDPGGSSVETGIGKVLGVLRPMFEIASRKVPLLTDGNIDKAKQILQTAPWSQTAFYRDKDGTLMCRTPNAFSDAQSSAKRGAVEAVLSALGVGVSDFWRADIFSCNDFLPDPPYSAGYLAGVPWVLADAKNPNNEAPDSATFPLPQNYLTQIASVLTELPARSDPVLNANQSGPALLQALVAYSVQKEQGDAAESVVRSSGAASMARSLGTPKMLYVEDAPQNEATFTVTTPKELARVSIPAVTGRATLGAYVAESLALQPPVMQKGSVTVAASKLVAAVAALPEHVRDLGTVKLSLEHLATCPIGELNVAFRTTLDAFSYRLDAWYTARAGRRLEQLRTAKPTGIYVGGFAWVDNLKPDVRPDSEGYLLAPSLGQAASAAILRSGFMANHEQGAFNIQLDSRRTRRAEDILQGLTRDQPLAALYGYRVERGLRDSLLGRFIWPLRLTYPWRPAGAAVTDEPKEAIGARDVVDGVALLAAWEVDPKTVRARLATSLARLVEPGAAANDEEWEKVTRIVEDTLDLADAVSDLLMAEGIHQIVQGNLERAGAAMAAIDKQALPVEPQVAKTPRGGASYTQRIAILCPASSAPDEAWPQDRRSKAEPSLNAWLAHMLGDPARYRFAARVQRGVTVDGQPVFDAGPVVVSLNDLDVSPLSAVLLATTVSAHRILGDAETGFRGRLVATLIAKVAGPDGVTGLDIQQEGVTPNGLGLGHFEALATTLRALIDNTRPLTRKDMVAPEDKIEKTLPDEGEYPGVDKDEIEARAADLIADFGALKTALDASVNADALLANLAALEDFLPRAAWPPEAVAIDSPGADPAFRDQRAAEALVALKAQTAAKLDAVTAPVQLLEGQAVATHAQLVKYASDRIKLLLGKDFPVLPRFALGGYAAEFNASLAEQDQLSLKNPWQVTGWIPKLARVREGLDRFAGALSAHEALVDLSGAEDFKLIQYPHRSGQVWAALPEAWKETEGKPLDPTQVPEELHAYLAAQPGMAYKNIQRAAPNLALVLHAPGSLEVVAEDAKLVGLVVDEWPELIPDPFQTAAIAFHYDAPGARPPQSIVLALPPRLQQESWHFDEVLDVLHEAWDLAKLRSVRPCDLEGGLGLLLPGNYLPQSYTDDLPSVHMLKVQRDARERLFKSALNKDGIIALGKV